MTSPSGQTASSKFDQPNLLWWEIEKTISDKDLSRRLQNIVTKSFLYTHLVTLDDDDVFEK